MSENNYGLPEPLTEQAIFDHVLEHMRRQRQPAQEWDDCLYRLEGGLACAVGCLIPDTLRPEKLQPDLSVRALIRGYRDPRGDEVQPCRGEEWEEWAEKVRPFVRLLEDLQTAHDSPLSFAENMWDYAKDGSWPPYVHPPTFLQGEDLQPYYMRQLELAFRLLARKWNLSYRPPEPDTLST